MLSVILYGRNDAHGYNLHKRAALSLNSIAELLDDQEDEIVFVDYNTPDETPTFPEAIQDTLTGRAIEKLRILRVRPEFHRRYAQKTRLVALEPQSRNIAIRRSNPRNQWVLSTNTDMIFVPHDAADTLSSAIGRLEDGYYHLPRFEVPESLWDRLDRMKPQLGMDSLRRWGRRFHLNEIVYGGYDNLYDAPGDFQLFLRSDLFEIAGFDERMVLGWHCDANVARRMNLLRGRIGTAVGSLFGYHCAHARQATSLHQSNRTQNSLDTFVVQIRDPVCRHQREDWGAPDAEIEEIRLGARRAARFATALSAAVAQDGPVSTEAAPYRPDFEPVFSADHVLPHLCSLIYELPAGLRFMWWGDNVELLTGLGKFLAAAHGAADIIVPHEIELAAGGDPAAEGVFERLPFEHALDQAEAFILQYPSADLRPKNLRKRLEWRVQQVLLRIIEAERARPAAMRRRLIAVNAIQTPLCVTLERAVAVSSVIFTTRLHHGFVLDPPQDSAPADPAWSTFCAALGRRRCFAEDEQRLMHAVLATRHDGEPNLPGWQRLALEIAAVADVPELARREYAINQLEREALAGAAATAIEAARRRCAEPPVALAARDEIPTRLCSGADWESSRWDELARRCFPDHEGYALLQRTRWHWERVGLLRNVLSHLDPGARPWIMVITEEPDCLPTLLSHAGYRVGYATVDELLADLPAADWQPALQVSGVLPPPDLHPLAQLRRETGPRFPGFAAVAALLAHGGAEQLRSVVERVAGLVVPLAHLEASLIVYLDHTDDGGGLSFAQWQTLFARDGLLGRVGLEPAGAVDTRIPLDTAVRYAEGDTVDPVPGFSFGHAGAIATSALVAARWRLADQAKGSRPAGASREPHDPPSSSPSIEGPFIRLLPEIEQNLLPLVRSSAPIERSFARIRVHELGGESDTIWLAACVDARRFAGLRLTMRGPDLDAGSVTQAIFRSEDGTVTIGTHRPGVGGSEILFEAGAPLGRGAVLLALWNRGFELEQLNLAGVSGE